MTDPIELLPLPPPDNPKRLGSWRSTDTIRAYASANVEAATKELRAEVERLRSGWEAERRVSAGLQTRIAELEREVKLRRDTALEALTTIRRRTGSVVIPILTKYHELLYAVGNKYEGETRHETALRYIRQAEAAPQPAQPKEKS